MSTPPSRLGKPLGSLDWSWFVNVREHEFTSEFLSATANAILAANQIINSLVFKEEDKQQLSADYKNILHSITGIIIPRPDSSSAAKITTYEWYNTWLNQQNITEYAESILIILNAVRAKQTGDMDDFMGYMRTVSKFIIYRYFSEKIPSGVNTGKYPLIVDSTSAYYTPVLQSIYNFFYNNNIGIYGIGNETIYDMCINSFTRDAIGNYNPIKEWCGCFSPDDPITIAAKKKYPQSASYSKECDPLCMNPYVIKLSNQKDASAPYINSGCIGATFCIMTKFSIGNSGFDGIINLEQNCPCAKNQSCFCIIDTTVEDIINRIRAPNGSSLADPVTFNQYCPGGQCLVTNPKTGEVTEKTCNNDAPNSTNKIHGATVGGNSNVGPNIWMIFLVLLGVGVLFILCARHIGYEPKYKVNGILKSKIKLSKNTRSTDLYLPVK